MFSLAFTQGIEEADSIYVVANGDGVRFLNDSNLDPVAFGRLCAAVTRKTIRDEVDQLWLCSSKMDYVVSEDYPPTLALEELQKTLPNATQEDVDNILEMEARFPAKLAGPDHPSIRNGSMIIFPASKRPRSKPRPESRQGRIRRSSDI